MLRLVSSIPVHPTKARSQCPDCHGTLAVLRVIPGRAKPEASAEFRSEYWTLRCTKCGGIHLDILKAPPLASDRHADSGADGSPVPGG